MNAANELIMWRWLARRCRDIASSLTLVPARWATCIGPRTSASVEPSR